MPPVTTKLESVSVCVASPLPVKPPVIIGSTILYSSAEPSPIIPPEIIILESISCLLDSPLANKPPVTTKLESISVCVAVPSTKTPAETWF